MEQSGSLRENIKENSDNLKIISKLNEEIKVLKKKMVSKDDSVSRLRDEKSRLMADTEELKR